WSFTPLRSTKPSSRGSLARIASPHRCRAFRKANEIADPPQRLAYRRAFPLEAQQIEALRADEGIGHQGSDLLRREGTEAAELPLRPARHVHDELDPAHDAGAHDL